MPPTLRSAQSSPAGKTTLSDLPPSVTPGRKAPRCTQCGQPRLGHPRSGCPSTSNTDSPTKKAKPNSLQENLSQVFGSMYLDPSAVLVEKATTIETPALEPSDTLASISTSAENILQDLTRPGFFSPVTVSDDDIKGSKGKDSAAPTNLALSKLQIKSGPQTLMPGTLKAPSWESSIDEFPDAVNSSGHSKTTPLAKKSLGVQTSYTNNIAPSPLVLPHSSGPPSTASFPAQPLLRSQTQEQRELFLSSLSQASPATVYIHKKQDVDEVEALAKAAKLQFRAVYSDNKDKDDVRLVIGTDLSAVEKLAEELDKSLREPVHNITNHFYIAETTDEKTSPSSSTFKAVASGAIVGAMGTWAGLAFS